ncbi:MAG: ABC transporter permease [Clostridia bacterium]|nr:ABC transporter permease [Clostridia bacterium]
MRRARSSLRLARGLLGGGDSDLPRLLSAVAGVAVVLAMGVMVLALGARFALPEDVAETVRGLPGSLVRVGIAEARTLPNGASLAGGVPLFTLDDWQQLRVAVGDAGDVAAQGAGHGNCPVEPGDPPDRVVYMTPVTPNYFAVRDLSLAEGRVPAMGEEGVVVGASVDVRVGDRIPDCALRSSRVAREVTVLGRLGETGDADLLNRSALEPIDPSRPLPQTYEQVGYYLWVKPAGADTQTVLDILRRNLPEHLSGADLAFVTFGVQRLVVEHTGAVTAVALLLFPVVISLMAALVLAVLALLRVIREIPQVGVKLAFGASPGRLAGEYGVRQVGLVVGAVAVGAACALPLRPLAERWLEQPVRISWPVLGLSAAWMLVLGFGASVLSAWSGTRVDPAEAVRQEPLTSPTGGWGLLRSGFAVASAGVAVGLATALVVLGVGEGTTRQTAQYLDRVGAHALVVRPASPGASTWFAPDAVPSGLDRVPGVESVEWTGRGVAVARSGPSDERQTVTVVAATESFLRQRGVDLAEGRYPRAPGGEIGEAAVGAQLAERLFGTADAVGSAFQLGDRTFRVVGVVAKPGAGEVDLGYQRAWSVFVAPPVGAELVESGIVAPEAAEAWLETSEGGDLDKVMAAVTAVLPQDFTVDFPWGDLSKAVDFQRRWTGRLFALAGIILVLSALAAGGVLLVWTMAHTKQIALRMAVGATPADVRRFVLGRSLRLSLCAETAAAALAVAAAAAMRLSGYPVAFSWQMPVLVVLFGAALVLGCGWGAVSYASRMDPSEGLRYE